MLFSIPVAKPVASRGLLHKVRVTPTFILYFRLSEESFLMEVIWGHNISIRSSGRYDSSEISINIHTYAHPHINILVHTLVYNTFKETFGCKIKNKF